MRLRFYRWSLRYRKRTKMTKLQEIEKLVIRNRIIIQRCRIQAMKPFDIAYYQGKMDALDHIYDLLSEDADV